MESKNLRPSGPSSDIKPNKTDLSSLTGTKYQNRSGKKRENVLPKSPSASISTGPVPTGSKNQKPWLPKQKGPDKRQQRTGGLVGSGTNRKNYHQVTDDPNDPDFDLMLSETGKKQNLAHLLNMKFQFAPRDTSVSNYWRATHSGNGGKGKRFSSYSGRAHLNKDHYLQANCQFVVKADGDYTVYLADPDLLVPWESIEQIRIWGSEVGSCPICLHPPVAAKMTRCGHIYCWPCILHFLALSDKPSRPCPICDVSVRIQDLKSVVALEQRNLKVGDALEMRLMKRDRHSLQPQPVSRSQESGVPSKQLKPSYLGKVGEDHVFSKLLLCTPNEVANLILQWEKTELQTQLESEKDCPESCFIQQALELLAVRENSTAVECLSSFATALDLTADNVNADTFKSDALTSMALHADTNIQPVEELIFGDLQSDVNSDVSSNTTHVDIPLGESSGFRKSLVASPDNVSVTDSHQHQQQKNVFYFYQSSDGQAIYLHHINVQMLVRYYGSLELCPETIHGRIVEIETLSMTEEWRNRLRYLGHIPVSKQFQIMEIALTEPELDFSILEEFKERVDERARRRRRKDREERRRELEIQRAEDAKWGRTKNQPIVRLDSQVHFPGFISPNSLELPNIGEEDTFVDISPASIERGAQQSAGMSFAQMLREGKNKIPTVWSTLSKSEINISESAFSLNKPGRYRNTSESESEIAEYAPAPEYKETFSSALAAAFDQAAKSRGANTADEKPENMSSKKSKKKVKQKVLFSTGMNFM
ncbi:RING finger protein 10-like [Daphnia pulex]|uniref:RING finger protein 10-like n=1 Tax=Daphnia pulex TaxID=6669 RepID=UPI001EDCF451|nr:RING finger protein 10-like [Daphnia pulex]